MAKPTHPYRSQIIPGLHRLLSILHPQLLPHCMATPQPDKERNLLVLERRTRTSVQNTQETSLQMPCVSTTRLQETIHPPHRRNSLWHGRRTLTRGRIQPLQTTKTQTSPPCVILHDIHANGKKLRHLQKRTTRHQQGIRTLEDPLRMDPQTNQNHHRPHPPHILEIPQKAQPPTGQMAYDAGRLLV